MKAGCTITFVSRNETVKLKSPEEAIPGQHLRTEELVEDWLKTTPEVSATEVEESKYGFVNSKLDREEHGDFENSRKERDSVRDSLPQHSEQLVRESRAASRTPERGRAEPKIPWPRQLGAVRVREPGEGG